MTKIRRFEVVATGSDQYTISVDGNPAKVNFTQAVVDEMKKYHPELPNVEEELISIIMKEIDEEFNLTKTELDSYAQTLRYILKD